MNKVFESKLLKQGDWNEIPTPQWHTKELKNTD